MGHHAKHVAAFAEDAGDVFKRTVGVCGGRDFACGCGVAEGDAVLRFELRERVGVAEVVALHVANGHLQHLALREAVGEGRARRLGLKVHLLADVVLAGVAHQSAWEQAGLAKDLEAVADAEDEASIGSELFYRLHDVGEAGDGTGAKIVAVCEAARDEDDIAALKVFRSVPEEADGLAELGLDDVVGVVVAV